MSGYVKFSFIVSGIIAILTFAVSIPANLLGTSTIRSGAAFLFFMTTLLGIRWIFCRFSPRETKGSDKPLTGQQIDLETPEDDVEFKDIYAPVDKATPEEATFKPISPPQLDTEQLANVIRKS